MEIFRSLAEARGRVGPCAITIGNFDGTHLAHQALFRETVSLAGLRGWNSALLTFDPHPATIVAPARVPKRLSTYEERLKIMAACGLQKAIILPFTQEFAAQAPDAFIRDVLCAAFDARAIVVGDNFRFGHKQAGNIHLLADLGIELGFSTHIEPARHWRHRTVSSTAVRQSISAGQVGLAARFLGRFYELTGPVVPGHGVGSKQTVPTLNLDPETEVLPLQGVYVSRTRDLDDGRHWDSITNVGMRPTFGGDRLTIETFLLTPFDGHTPARIAVGLLRRVRDERTFDSPEALKAQIFRDVARAQAYHRRLNKWVRPL